MPMRFSFDRKSAGCLSRFRLASVRPAESTQSLRDTSLAVPDGASMKCAVQPHPRPHHAASKCRCWTFRGNISKFARKS